MTALADNLSWPVFLPLGSKLLEKEVTEVGLVSGDHMLFVKEILKVRRSSGCETVYETGSL